MGLWLLVVCYLGEWQRTPLSLGGGQSNPTGKLREHVFAFFFGPRVGAGTHTAVLSTVVKQIVISALFPTWPRALSLFSFLALALETVHLIIM